MPPKAQSTRKGHNGHLVPQPIDAAVVLRRLVAALTAAGETLRLAGDGAGVRYYRQTPAGWVRLTQPGGHAEYPLTPRDRALLRQPAP